MKKLAVLAILAAAGAAQADTLDIDMSGWQTWGGYLDAGNSSAVINLPIGTTIDHVEFIDLNFETIGVSWLTEFTLSLNDSELAVDFWDYFPSLDENSGVFSGSGSFTDNLDQSIGGPFTMTTDQLFVTVYESWNDAGQDAQVNSGTLRIHYTVPAPGAAALLGLGGLVAARRRRA